MNLNSSSKKALLAGAVFSLSFLPIQLSPAFTVVSLSAGLVTVYYLMKSAYEIEGKWPEGYLEEVHEEKFPALLLTSFVYVPARFQAWRKSRGVNTNKITEGGE